MDKFTLQNIAEALPSAPVIYEEFLRVPALSAGIYRLEAGTKDPQLPHDQDEIYYVISGGADITVKGETQPVNPGDLIYVAALDEHRFSSINDTLVVLVLFAPAETINQAGR